MSERKSVYTFGVVKGAKLTLRSNETDKSQRLELHKKKRRKKEGKKYQKIV